MEKNTNEYHQFLEWLFDDELTPEKLEALDERMKDPQFREAYHKFEEVYYRRSWKEKLMAYLPMVIFIIMIILGVVLYFLN